MRRGSADSIRASRQNRLCKQAGYKAIICRSPHTNILPFYAGGVHATSVIGSTGMRSWLGHFCADMRVPTKGQGKQMGQSEAAAAAPKSEKTASGRRGIAVEGATIRLEARGPWFFGGGKSLNLEATKASSVYRINGRRGLLGADLTMAIEEGVRGAKYHHVTAAVKAGTIGSVRMTVEPGSLSRAFSNAKAPLARSGTGGTFVLTAETLSEVPGNPPAPDPIGAHRGTWEVTDPRQELAGERGGVRNEAAEKRKDLDRTVYTISASARINDGALVGVKGLHDVHIAFGDGEPEVSATRDWFETKIGGNTLAPIGSSFKNLEIIEKSRDKVIMRIRGAGKAGIGKHYGGETGKFLGAFAVWLPGGDVLAYLAGWAVGRDVYECRPDRVNWEIARRIECGRLLGGEVGAWTGEGLTPAIDYDYRIELRRDGTGRVAGRHNRFPSYAIHLVRPGAQDYEEIHYYPHPKTEWKVKLTPRRFVRVLPDKVKVDLTGLYAASGLPDVEIQIGDWTALSTWEYVDEEIKAPSNGSRQ